MNVTEEEEGLGFDSDEVFEKIDNRTFRAVVDDPLQMLYPWRHQPSMLVGVGVHCAVFLVGAMGHIVMLIYLFTTNIRKHNITTGIFLASLSAAELLMLFVYIPLEIWKSVWPQAAKGGAICKVTEYVKMLTAAASVINLAAVSIERYIVVVHPIKSKMLCTRPKCIISVISVWILAFILSTPVILTNDVYSIIYTDKNNTMNVEVFMCTDDTEIGTAPWTGRLVSLYQLFVLLIIPLLLSTCCYQAVIRVLWRSVRNIHTLSNCGTLVGGHQARCYSFKTVPNPEPSNQDTGVNQDTLNTRDSRINSIHVNPQIDGGIDNPRMAESSFINNCTGRGSQDQPGTRARHAGSQDNPGTRGRTVGTQDQPGTRGRTGGSQDQPGTRPRVSGSQDLPVTRTRTARMSRSGCQCNQGWLAAQKINNGRKKIIKMLILILIMYFFCWGIWLSSRLIMWWAGNTTIPYSPAYYRFTVVAKHLPAVHATINPVIYSMLSGNFRKHICICK